MKSTILQVSRLIKRSLYLLQESIGWIYRRDFYCWHLSGVENGETLSLCFVGRDKVRNDLSQSFFKNPVETKMAGPWRRWQALKHLRQATTSDIVVGELPPWATKVPSGSFSYQTITESVIDLSQGFDIWIDSVNSSQVQRYKQSVTNGDCIFWSDTPEDIGRFYSEMLVPTINNRHGENTSLPSLDFFVTHRRAGCLLLLKNSKGDWLGGAYILKGRLSPWRYLSTGVSENIVTDSKVRGMINCRMSVEAAKAAAAAGQTSLCLGLSPAAYNNGIFENKRRYGAKPVNRLIDYPVCFVSTLTERGKAELDRLRPYVIRREDISPYVPRSTGNISNKESTDQAQEAIGKGILDAATHIGIATAITMFLGLGLRLALPRIYGPANMGIFFFTDSLTAMIFCFLPLGLSSYISREVPKDPNKVPGILSSIIPAQALMGMLLILGLVIFLRQTGADSMTSNCAIALACYSFSMTIYRSILSRVYLSLGKSALVARSEVAIRVGLIALVAGVLLLRWSIVAVAISFAIAQSMGTLWMLWRAKKDGFLSRPFNWVLFKEMAVSSLPFLAIGALIEVYGALDTMMLQYFSGSEEVAFYGTANKLKGAGFALLPIIQGALQPALARTWAADRELFRSLVSSSMRLLVAASLPMALVLMVLPDLISNFLFGGAFAPSYRAISYLAPVLTLTYLNFLMGSCLNITGSGRSFLAITAISVAINGILNAFGIALFQKYLGAGGGAAAAALATVISEVFVLLMMRSIFTVGLDFPALVRRMLLTLVPCVLIGMAGPAILEINPWLRLAILMILTPLYLFLTGLVSRDDISWLLHIKFKYDRRRK